MTPLCKTSDMETSARLLSRHFDRVLVNGIYKLAHPVRIRPKLLGDQLRIARNATGGEREAERWNLNGGILLNYRPENRACDAMLFCECPLSLAELFKRTDDTGARVAVVYRPPSWRGHAETLQRLYPSPEECEAMYNAMHSYGLDERHAAMLSALGLPVDGAVATTDRLTRQQDGARKALLAGARTTTYCRVWPIIPRVEPRERDLMALYRAVCALPLSESGERLAVDSALYAASATWRVQLRELSRAGCVTLRDRVSFYIPEKIKPNWVKLEREHSRASVELARIIGLVEAAPILSPKKAEALASRRALPETPQSSSSTGAPPESSVSAPDITY